MGLNAQTAVPVFTSGQILTAQQQTEINTGIPVFATTTTRDAAFGGTGEKVLAQGQYCFIEATNQTQYYNGSAWVPVNLGAWTTFNPTITALSGTFTSVAATGQYAQIGKTVVFSFSINIINNGTAATGIYMTLPVTPFNYVSTNIVRDDAVTGTIGQAWIVSPTQGLIRNTTNGYFGGTGYVIIGSITYQAA